MNNHEVNPSIHCTVEECRYHNADENFCSLNSIQVAAHTKNPDTEKCVDCKSFQCKNGNCSC